MPPIGGGMGRDGGAIAGDSEVPGVDQPKLIGFGANAYTYLGNIAYINSDIPEYANNNFIFEKDVLNHCEQFAWEFLFLIRARPLYRQDIIERYGTIISKRMETILRTFFEKNILSQSKIYR